jgi:hypothetical protein
MDVFKYRAIAVLRLGCNTPSGQAMNHATVSANLHSSGLFFASLLASFASLQQRNPVS